TSTSVTVPQGTLRGCRPYSRRLSMPSPSLEASAMPTNPFAEMPVIGALLPAAAAAKLRELGEDPAASALEEVAKHPPATFGPDRRWWPLGDRAWQHTAHAFGFLPATGHIQPAAIQAVGGMAPDLSLRNTRVKITLNRLRVADYPGGGTHRILFDFYARN